MVKLIPPTFSSDAKDTDWFETEKGVVNLPNSSGGLIVTSEPSAPITFKRKAFDKISASTPAFKVPSSKFRSGLSLSDSTDFSASKVRRVEKFENMPEASPSVADNP